MLIRNMMPLAAVLLAAACEVPLAVIDPDFGVVSVAVAPKSVTLSVGDSMQLNATVLMSNNRPPHSVSWTSSNVNYATVNKSGMVYGVGAGDVWIYATSASKKDSAAITVVALPPAPVASVSVSPPAVTLLVSSVIQLTATPKDSAGNPLSGRTVSWSSDNTAVASVNGSGLVTGLAAGSAIVTATSEGKSGSSAITVATPPPPAIGSCLTQTGSTVTVSGVRTSQFYNTSLADNTKLDGSTAQFLVGASVNIPVVFAGGSRICWSGGQILGRFAPNTAWNTMHDKYGMIPAVTWSASAKLAKVENLTVFSYGDGISFDDQGDSAWSIRNVHVKYSRDDCVENDFLNSGTIDSSLFDGCYDGMSSREYSTVRDGSNNVVTISNSLWRLQAMDSVYASDPTPSHYAFWKWSGSGNPNTGIGPKLALYNNVFRADENSLAWNGKAGMYMAPPQGKLADCQNNVMVWLGSGSFPETLPTTFNGKTCFTLMTGAAGLQYWDNAVAQWKANHPAALPDVGPPIVSMFSPGIVGSTTLKGIVSLTATAVDDQAVVGVQLQMNGQNIGTEVTTESPITKFTLSWNSASLPNGTYTLTATARDATGNTTTSAGLTVTISN